MRLFKERFTMSVTYLGAAILGAVTGVLIVSSVFNMYALLSFPVIGAVIKVGIVGAFLIVICALIIEFINWLIVEPYRNQKRLEADVKRETEGPVE
ncbi:hypothetical protein P9D80_03315 [Bacillus spizizenii]|uniref:hypothetical protein n=1 Tax=Bacillus spizizenii TaxID=96241 RepID=UPI002DB7A90F|nr:hypothetical protein [Bacillus spizizenii]MEC1584392.1 hypothetical protein [Bacillus spizizenii]